jgi:AraC family transcriptional regulator
MHVSRVGVQIEAEASVRGAQVQLVNYRFPEPPESRMRFDGRIRVELCLTSNHRTARACFPDRWRSQRFERMGDVYIMPPSMTMHVRSDETSPLSSVVCHLDLHEALCRYDLEPMDLTERFLVASLDIRDLTVRQLMSRLARELRHPGFASAVLIESIVTGLQVELIRYRTAIADHAAPGRLAPWQLRLIDERIQEPGQAPSLSELAALCRVSVRQLGRGFRACRGSSIGSFVATRQMEHACRLLATDISVADIATTLGFSSSSNFCVAFRRAMGTTPGRVPSHPATTLSLEEQGDPP